MAITGKTVTRVPGIEKLSAAQLRALDAAANKLGIPVDWLATVISFETRDLLPGRDGEKRRLRDRNGSGRRVYAKQGV